VQKMNYFVEKTNIQNKANFKYKLLIFAFSFF